ncbi:PadR family transcriptional regulator [Cellulomonas telluris]|uniref:PadR family transcriptional regulator n=1 Tax=Cellulomonas telluris TaxID=2306636 RepID=UPI0010A7CCCB|nr:PadR family transcriptional regulator [Cellulomonas telluris]
MADARDPQLLKGVLPMLVLAALAQEEAYGYALVVRLREAGLDELSTGTLYPVLTRLEREGLVTSRLVPSDSGPARKYYRLSAPGTLALAGRRDAWRDLVRTSEGLLSAVPGPDTYPYVPDRGGPPGPDDPGTALAPVPAPGGPR